MNSESWQPTASLTTLKLRAAMLAEVREYFRAEGVLEVETPVLSQSTVTDIHMASLRTSVQGQGTFYLQTSPEYAMKRLLAAGSGDVYQIARVFRDGERGAQHNPEFTLVEWYRLGFDLPALMGDTERLLGRLLQGRLELAQTQRISYRRAVIEHAGVDPFKSSVGEILACLGRHGVAVPRTPPDDRDVCLDLLMSTVVGPKLGAGRLSFIHDYPASQAALARVKPGEPAVAERFEVYLQGIELANGFHELADAQEQGRRFESDLEVRRARGLESLPIDHRLLSALNAGLPDCSGVAVGFDRVVMLAAAAARIEAVLAFPIERA